jgi:hypothetical protein
MTFNATESNTPWCITPSPEGLELPVVDVSQPVFALEVDATDQKALDSSGRRLHSASSLQLRNPLLRFLRRLILAQVSAVRKCAFLPAAHHPPQARPEMLGNAYQAD